MEPHIVAEIHNARLVCFDKTWGQNPPQTEQITILEIKQQDAMGETAWREVLRLVDGRVGKSGSSPSVNTLKWAVDLLVQLVASAHYVKEEGTDVDTD